MRRDTGTAGCAKLFAVCLVIGATGCLPADPTGPSARSQLDGHRALWEAHRPVSYEIDVEYTCYCFPEFVRLRVNVAGDDIESVFDIDMEEIVAARRGWESVDGLFALIEDAIDRDADRIDVEYDRDLGYPKSVFISYNADGFSHDEVGLKIVTLREAVELP